MDLHGQIMTLRQGDAPTLPVVGGSTAHRENLAYGIGYRDARHAAAELALKADAEIEALRKDAERYRWLRSYANIGTAHIATPDGWKHFSSGADEVVDAAIDAAMEKP